MNSGKISVIVPIYNAALYLRTCLDSVVNQTYQNLEIICVDDGSTDESGNILAEFANKDERILPIHTENSGVSSARNTALSAASGDFIMFVDGDDWIDLDTCEIALNAIVANEADLVTWAYVREYPTSSQPRLVFQGNRLFDENGCAALWRRMVGLVEDELKTPESADSLSCVWGKLYRRETIIDHNVFFTDLKRIGSYEDGLFNLRCFSHVKKAYYIANPMYHYRKGSGMTSRYREELRKQWNNLFDDIKHYIDTTDCDKPLLYFALDNRISLSIIGLGLNAICLPNAKAYQEIKSILRDERYRKAIRTLPLRFFPVHWWFFFLFAKLNFAGGTFIILKCMNYLMSKKK